jgi:hypothetical protein
MLEQLDQFYLLTDKKPNEAHANRDGYILYYVQVIGFMQGHWNYPPSNSTHWTMLPDPPEPALTEKELLEKDFDQLMKQEFPEPIVSNILIEPVLRKFFFRGKTL